jgi:hypothetical protein
VLREQVATALVNKGVALGKLGRSADPVAAFEEAMLFRRARTEADWPPLGTDIGAQK